MRDTYGTSIVSKYNSDFGEVSPKRLRGDIAHPFPPYWEVAIEAMKELVLSQIYPLNTD